MHNMAGATACNWRNIAGALQLTFATQRAPKDNEAETTSFEVDGSHGMEEWSGSPAAEAECMLLASEVCGDEGTRHGVLHCLS